MIREGEIPDFSLVVGNLNLRHLTVGLFSGAEPTITLPASIFASVIPESQRSLEAHSLVSRKDWAEYFAIGILL